MDCHLGMLNFDLRIAFERYQVIMSINITLLLTQSLLILSVFVYRVFRKLLVKNCNTFCAVICHRWSTVNKYLVCSILVTSLKNCPSCLLQIVTFVKLHAWNDTTQETENQHKCMFLCFSASKRESPPQTVQCTTRQGSMYFITCFS